MNTNTVALVRGARRVMVGMALAGAVVAGASVAARTGSGGVVATAPARAAAVLGHAAATAPGTSPLNLANQPPQHANPALDQPPDYRVTQSNLLAGVPLDAFNQAVAQAQALRTATAQQAPALAGSAWNFVGPTNIGGRIADLAIDPHNGNTGLCSHRGWRGLEEHRRRGHLRARVAGDQHAVDGRHCDRIGRHHLCGHRGVQSRRRQHHLWWHGHLPLA